jgi:malate dehydrogenase
MIKKMIACSVFVEGEYGQHICIGVPCIIGKNGVEEIDIKLDNEKHYLQKCRCCSFK